MAWKSAAYTGTHQERKEASKAIRGNVRRAALAEATEDLPRPKHASRSKPYGLVIFKGPGLFGDDLTWTQWYATERDRDNAIVAANKEATSKYMPVIALGKVER